MRALTPDSQIREQLLRLEAVSLTVQERSEHAEIHRLAKSTRLRMNHKLFLAFHNVSDPQRLVDIARFRLKLGEVIDSADIGPRLLHIPHGCRASAEVGRHLTVYSR